MPDETIGSEVGLEEGQEPVPAVAPETATDDEESTVVADEDEEEVSDELLD